MKTKNIFRMLLVAAALLMGANNVKATTYKYQKETFANLNSSSTIRVSCSDINIYSWQITFATLNDQTPDFDDWHGGIDWGATWYYTKSNSNHEQYLVNTGNSYYFDLKCNQKTVDKLSNYGLKIDAQNLTVTGITIDGSSGGGGGSSTTTDVPAWSYSGDGDGQWLNNWNPYNLPSGTFNSLKCDGTDVIRVYGKLGNLGTTPDGSETILYGIELVADWNDSAKKIKHTGTDNFAAGYYDFTNVSSTLANALKSTGIINGYNFYVTSIVVNPSSTSTKTTPTLTFPQNTYNITFGDSFTGPTATCDISSLEITYESSNRNVADVATYTGEVTINGAGQAIITAKTQASDEYNEASASYTINVAKVNYTLSYSASTATAVLGQSWTAPTLNNPSNISVTYSSTNTGVATIDQYGNVTLLAAGQTTIKANYAGDNNHEAKEASYVLTVSTASAPAKQDVTLTFSPSTATATMGETFTEPTLTATANNETVTGLNISYSSSNTSVATVASNGDVTLVAAGTTTITASFAGNDSYNPASASYTLTVNAAAPSASDYIDVSIDGNLASYGYRTYVTPQAVDLSGSIGVQAYYATGLNTAGTEVQFTEVTGVCASGVPLLLKAKTSATEYKLLKSTATGTTPSGNKLQPGQGDNVQGSYKYVLTVHSGVVVFTEVNIEGAPVDTEHAYLDLNGSNARGRLTIKLSGESTGIQSLQNDERALDGAIYNLRGQRVENPTKGLYIINGKKVVIK